MVYLWLVVFFAIINILVWHALHNKSLKSVAYCAGVRLFAQDARNLYKTCFNLRLTETKSKNDKGN